MRRTSSVLTYSLNVERFTLQAYQSGMANKASTIALSAMYATANLEGEKRKIFNVCARNSVRVDSTPAQAEGEFNVVTQRASRRVDHRSRVLDRFAHGVEQFFAGEWLRQDLADVKTAGRIFGPPEPLPKARG